MYNALLESIYKPRNCLSISFVAKRHTTGFFVIHHNYKPNNVIMPVCFKVSALYLHCYCFHSHSLCAFFCIYQLLARRLLSTKMCDKNVVCSHSFRLYIRWGIAIWRPRLVLSVGIAKTWWSMTLSIIFTKDNLISPVGYNLKFNCTLCVLQLNKN